jgi:YggT family protein
MIEALLWLFNTVIGLYIFVLLAMVVMSWLTAFNVINTRSPVVGQVERVLNALTEPALRPIRKVLPNLGGLDLSPLVLFLILGFVQRLVNNLVIGNALFSI